MAKFASFIATVKPHVIVDFYLKELYCQISVVCLG